MFGGQPKCLFFLINLVEHHGGGGGGGDEHVCSNPLTLFQCSNKA